MSPAPRGGPGRTGGGLAGLLAAADALEESAVRLESRPGVEREALALLRRRAPSLEEGSPLSTAFLVRLAGEAGAAGLAAVLPFTADANPLVQVEAAEAMDSAPFPLLRSTLERLAKEQPAAPWWESVASLLEAREEQGLGRLFAELLSRVTRPEAQAAFLEALPAVAEPADLPRVKAAVKKFSADGRALPGGETGEGPLTFALLADETLRLLDVEG